MTVRMSCWSSPTHIVLLLPQLVPQSGLNTHFPFLATLPAEFSPCGTSSSDSPQVSPTPLLILGFSWENLCSHRLSSAWTVDLSGSPSAPADSTLGMAGRCCHVQPHPWWCPRLESPWRIPGSLCDISQELRELIPPSQRGEQPGCDDSQGRCCWEVPKLFPRDFPVSGMLCSTPQTDRNPDGSGDIPPFPSQK